MEINVDFVLYEELNEKPESGVETRIVILRESKDADSALDCATPDCDSYE